MELVSITPTREVENVPYKWSHVDNVPGDRTQILENIGDLGGRFEFSIG